MSSEKNDLPSPSSENVENYGAIGVGGGAAAAGAAGGGDGPVDDATERRLLRKLDKRIVPCIMWMYLMNFMDRGGLPSVYAEQKEVAC